MLHHNIQVCLAVNTTKAIVAAVSAQDVIHAALRRLHLDTLDVHLLGVMAGTKGRVRGVCRRCSKVLGVHVIFWTATRETDNERCHRSEERRVGKECRSRWSAAE